MTVGQAEIFMAATDPKYRWVWTSAPTRYGKTEILALAFIYLAVFYHLKIPIVAGSEDKAKKIMEYVVSHIGDHPDLYAELINIFQVEDVEKLKVTVTKDALRWRDGGWVYITSIDSRNTIKEGEGVVGEGGDVIALEEAGLIKHKEQFSKIVRMAEEDKGWGKLIMSGNCIENSVFDDAYKDPKFHKVRVGLEQAIAEGRYTSEYLEEKKSLTTSKDWKRYYLVEFPQANEFTYFKPKKYDTLPPNLKYYGSCDPALGETAKGSLVGITVIGVDANKQAYQVHSFGQTIRPEEMIKTIFNLPYKFERFGIERVQFQKYFLDSIDKQSKLEGRFIPFEGILQKRKKEERIEGLEPAINTGQILFKGDDILWEHMQDYPNLELLDVLDSLEMTWRLVVGNKVDFFFT